MGIENAVDKILYDNLAGTISTDLYTVPTSTKTRIASIVVTNVALAQLYLTLFHVSESGSIDDSTILGNKMRKLDGTLGQHGGQVYTHEIPFPMVAGDKISIVSQTASTMKVKIVGLEEAL